MKKQILSVSDSALVKIKEIISQREVTPLGLRITLKTKGCSGLSWAMDFIDETNKFDEHLQIGELNLYVDPKAILFVLGTHIDYIQTELEEGFKFTNPNEKGRCGCGESFTV